MIRILKSVRLPAFEGLCDPDCEVLRALRSSSAIGSYPRVRIEGGGRAAVSQAGGVLLVETVRKAGCIPRYRRRSGRGGSRGASDPGKVSLDVALAVALGGDCLADVAMLRAEPAVCGPVASGPTVSRLVDTLAGFGGEALAAIRAAQAEARTRVWKLTQGHAPRCRRDGDR